MKFTEDQRKAIQTLQMSGVKVLDAVERVLSAGEEVPEPATPEGVTYTETWDDPAQPSLLDVIREEFADPR